MTKVKESSAYMYMYHTTEGGVGRGVTTGERRERLTSLDTDHDSKNFKMLQ